MRQFNGWTFVESEMQVEFWSPSKSYKFIMNSNPNSAEVLDWIAQIASKGWGTDAVLAGLVRTMNFVFGLQANVCSGGVDVGETNVKD